MEEESLLRRPPVAYHINAPGSISLRVTAWYLGDIDAAGAAEIECSVMKRNASWPKVFAYIGLVIFGAVLAYYSTAVATAGVAGHIVGTDPYGDTLTMGGAVLVTGIAVAAVFAFLAITNARSLMRRS
jgi:hypothetical protein